MSMTKRSYVYGRGQDVVPVAAIAPAAAGTFIPDLNRGSHFIVTMPAGNITIAAPVNARPGAVLDLEIVQDSVGSRTVTWNAIFHFAANTAPTLTTTANRHDQFRFVYNGTAWVEIARTLNVV